MSEPIFIGTLITPKQVQDLHVQIAVPRYNDMSLAQKEGWGVLTVGLTLNLQMPY